MKKNNFTENQIAAIVTTLSPKINVRINKAGNITVTNPKEKGSGYWTLYNLGDENYMWRRHDGSGYCYPLNMIGRKRVGEVHKETYNGKIFYWYNRDWNIDNCKFYSFESALNYFVKYLKKYRKVNI